MELKIEGAEKHSVLGAKLKAAGDRELKRNLTRTLKDAASPLVPKVKESASSVLPRAGGLASTVANARVTVTTRLTGEKVGVRVQARWPGHNPGPLNRGRFKHPVFGNPDVWVEQQITPGWFSTPLQTAAPFARRAVVDAIEETARGLHG